MNEIQHLTEEVMPEGPEVYDYCKFIAPLLKHQQLKGIEILSGKYTRQAPEHFDDLNSMLPCNIKHVFPKGKTIFIVLDNNKSLVFTHGMTGFWSDVHAKHSRIALHLETSTTLYFEDARNFGLFRICDNKEQLQSRIDYQGPDVLSEVPDFEEFERRLVKRQRSKIGTVLLDQTVISGVGNYLRCDVLWYCAIDAETRIGDLSICQIKQVFETCIQMTRYHAGLSSNLRIKPCDFGMKTFVYMQDTDPLGRPVCVKKFAGRTLHFVDNNHNTQCISSNK